MIMAVLPTPSLLAGLTYIRKCLPVGHTIFNASEPLGQLLWVVVVFATRLVCRFARISRSSVLWKAQSVDGPLDLCPSVCICSSSFCTRAVWLIKVSKVSPDTSAIIPKHLNFAELG